MAFSPVANDGQRRTPMQFKFDFGLRTFSLIAAPIEWNSAVSYNDNILQNVCKSMLPFFLSMGDEQPPRYWF
ncbi:MAG: hypothetical protein LBV29_07350 [Azoarcus sp.]|nr:hypothetical protein [Azoarcus sp.]